jgi:hypothetical protein
MPLNRGSLKRGYQQRLHLLSQVHSTSPHGKAGQLLTNTFLPLLPRVDDESRSLAVASPIVTAAARAAGGPRFGLSRGRIRLNHPECLQNLASAADWIEADWSPGADKHPGVPTASDPHGSRRGRVAAAP